MRLNLRHALLLPLAILAPSPALAQNADLALVQAHLKGATSMTANFVQTDRNGKSLSGTLTLQRPGKVRFQYEAGVPLLIVADGRSLYFIDYSVKQVSRWPIGGSPLAAILDPNRDISGIAKVVNGDPRLVQVDVRDPRHPEYGRIVLVFARDGGGPGGLALQGWTALDAQNNRTTVRLSAQRYNVGIAGNAFRWNDPRVSPKRN